MSIASLSKCLPVLALLVPLVLPARARADIFQYTDKDGVIHFSSKRPAVAGAKVYLRGNGSKGGASAAPGKSGAPKDRDPARYTRYDTWVREAAALYQIPVELVRAVIKVESDYDPRALSYAGARGLMQLMPDTATSLDVRDIDDPRENIFGGVRFLRILANAFGGDLVLTVAGYNAGQEAVMRHGGVPPYAQTRDYVTKVLGHYRRYQAEKVAAPTQQPSDAAQPVK